VPAGAATGQLSIVRGDNGQSSITGVTVTVGGPLPTIVNLGDSIQAAIDAAVTGGLIIVRPGNYIENIIMNKNGNGILRLLDDHQFCADIARKPSELQAEVQTFSILMPYPHPRREFDFAY
jgi:hypothetical protein